MEQDQIERVREELAEVPEGALRQICQSQDGAETVDLPGRFATGEKGREVCWDLYPGIALCFLDYLADHTGCRHQRTDGVLEIDYCRRGRAGWRMRDGSAIYLGAGDLCLHTRELCAGSVMTLPNGYYSGLTVRLDLAELAEHPPELLAEAGVSGEVLRRRFCPDGGFTSFPGNGQTEAIFSGFYAPLPSAIRPYWKLKALELLLYLQGLERPPRRETSPCQAEQIETVRAVHDLLTGDLARRVTIEELSRRFLMNPSTLKSVFKEVYGDSIAAHIREHRMERAALLLRETEDTVAQVARAVGYESQSRFSSEFRRAYQLLPREYRRLHREDGPGEGERRPAPDR